ncbi:phospholipase D family protein [Pelagibacterium sediminicola]|uniref:phospholipase D family protein n=1 Tax=Pelagibacterium sediminicola TaxID=2248761 RepID=UPI000E312287|nr:phospholipase D family protein [Pelagibacterium sediminicola]
MKLILNGLNGSYLRDLLELAPDKTERVDAAVAYATENDLLFSWCWDNSIPLRYWGRFDEQVPVSIPVLEKFFSRRSGRYTCKLVRKFHPKVIWWRGFGAYIGSANLTQSAWWNNVEAGVFLTEDEMQVEGHDLDLETMFSEIDSHAAPLTEELLELLRKRNAELKRRKIAQKSSDNAFVSTTLVPHWEGLARVGKKTANERKRQAFLDEWNSTLQIIRNVGATISKKENRPAWVGDDVPLGVQADQFLHAYYYTNVIDERRRSNFEALFAANRNDPDTAVQLAIRFWQGLPSSSDEYRALNEIAPVLRGAFERDRLKRLTEDEFVKVLSDIHAASEYARRVSNRIVGLRNGVTYTIPEKMDALARHIYRGPARGGNSVIDTLDFILYGGSATEVPHRLWDTMNDPTRRIDLLGISSLGEIVGWALPDLYPPRNGRTSKALRALGYDVTVHVG